MYHVSILPNSTARLGRNINGQDLERSGRAVCLEGGPQAERMRYRMRDAGCGLFEWWVVVEDGKPRSRSLHAVTAHLSNVLALLVLYKAHFPLY